MIECLSNVLSVVQFCSVYNCIIAFIPFFKRFWMKGIDFKSVIHAYTFVPGTGLLFKAEIDSFLTKKLCI